MQRIRRVFVVELKKIGVSELEIPKVYFDFIEFESSYGIRDITNPLKTALTGGKTAAELERAAFKGTLVGTGVGLGMMGIHKYADNKQKMAQQKEKEASQAMVDFASNDETMQQAASSEMQGLLNQFKTMDNQ